MHFSWNIRIPLSKDCSFFVFYLLAVLAEKWAWSVWSTDISKSYFQNSQQELCTKNYFFGGKVGCDRCVASSVLISAQVPLRYCRTLYCELNTYKWKVPTYCSSVQAEMWHANMIKIFPFLFVNAIYQYRNHGDNPEYPRI